MRAVVHDVVLSSEAGDLADEVRHLFMELGLSPSHGLAHEYAPPLDVYETDEAVEVRVDLPGVDVGAIRLIVKSDGLAVVGEKAPRPGRRDSSFHLIERGFGRFARIVRLSSPCDATRAEAILVDGELRVTVPKVVERRGLVIRVPVERGANGTARSKVTQGG